MEKQQHIACQHHTLDLLLKHIINCEFPESSTSPNISTEPFNSIILEYDILVSNFEQDADSHIVSQKTWSEDMDFLLHLLQFFQKNDIFPYINFRKLPNISNARWNSRAILAILSFILLPNHRPKLKRLCNYISGFWSEALCSNQFFDDDIYFKLC